MPILEPQNPASCGELTGHRVGEPRGLPVLSELASLRPGIDVNDGSALRVILDESGLADPDQR